MTTSDRIDHDNIGQNNNGSNMYEHTGIDYGLWKIIWRYFAQI